MPPAAHPHRPPRETAATLRSAMLYLLHSPAWAPEGQPPQPLPLTLPAALLVVLAVLCRVGLPLLWPAAYLHWLGLSGTLVVLAFSLYLWVYTPWLLRARVDGRPG